MYHFGHLIRILHCSTRQETTKVLASMDLTSAQGHIMGYLEHCETPPCARDIEERFRLSHPTVSGLLSRLEKKEFITFRPDENDRRCKRIYVLPKGKEFSQTIWQTILDTESRLVADFTEEEKAQFRSFLARAVVNMGGDPDFHPDKEDKQP